eukprot:622976-Prorocentrum_minimum.AAC.1
MRNEPGMLLLASAHEYTYTPRACTRRGSSTRRTRTLAPRRCARSCCAGRGPYFSTAPAAASWTSSARETTSAVRAPGLDTDIGSPTLYTGASYGTWISPRN